MGAALDRRRLAVSGNDAHAFVNPRDDVISGTGLQECHAVLAASGKDAIARLLHLGWEGLAWNDAIAERKAEVARSDLGKSQSRDAENLLAIGDALGAFQLHPQQQLAFRIERPGVTAIHVVLGRQAPDRRRRTLRSTPTRADVEKRSAGNSSRSLQPRQRRR